MEQYRTETARWAGWLFLVSGLLTIVNNYLPDSDYLNRGFLNALGAMAVFLGLLVPALPWVRWPARTQLLLVPVALAMITAADLFGGVSAYSYAVYYVVLFVWVGLAQPPRTAYFVAPATVVAYVVPGILAAERGGAAISSVTVAVPVCVLVAETIARVMRKAQLRGELLHLVAVASGRMTSVESEEVLNSVVAVTADFGFDSAYLAEANNASGMFLILRAYGVIDAITGETFPLSMGASGRARETGTVVVVDDYQHSPDALRAFKQAGMNMAMSAPVWIGNEVVAVLTGLTRKKKRPTPLDIEAFMLLAAQAGHALKLVRGVEYQRNETKRALEASLRDDLTGVGNRRYADQLLGSLQLGDGLLVIDLDHFKGINDTYGHVVGDEVLTQLGTYLKEHLRDGDAVARYGGEEFIVVLRGAGQEALAVADRLINGWRSLKPLTTISGGFAMHTFLGPIATLKRADTALYEAKRAGRDQLRVSPSGLPYRLSA